MDSDAKRMRLDIVHPHLGPESRAFDDWHDFLYYSLRANGIDCDIHQDSWPAEGVPLFLGYSQLPDDTKLKPCIIVQTEVIADGAVFGHTGTRDAALEILRRAEAVWDFDEGNIEQLKALDINAVHVPLGYVPEMRRYEQAAVKDIDFLFYGSRNERRDRILCELESYGKNVVCDLVPQGPYGPQRDAMIARAKVMPYMYFYEAHEGHLFGTLRPGYLLNNGSLTVVEDCESYRRAWPDAPLLVADYEDLVTVLMEAVEFHEDDRAAMAHACAEWWQGRPMAPTVARAVKETACLS